MADPDKRGPKKRKLICVRWFVHPKTKKRVYPKNGKVFCFWVDE
jgi:hypothetical protein